MAHEPEEAHGKAHSPSQPLEDSGANLESSDSSTATPGLAEESLGSDAHDPSGPPSEVSPHSSYHDNYPHAAMQPAPDEEEEGGGPVKSFLEHLEDLRWTIIRCLAALLIAMVGCLVAAKQVIALLKQPLERAQLLVDRPDQPVALFEFGTNHWVLNLETNQPGLIHFGTNRSVKLVLNPIRVGTNIVLGLTPGPLDPEELPPAHRVALKNYTPVGPFVVALKLALFGGIGLASPLILLFIGQFVVPALHRKEKKYLYRAVAIGAVLFMCGVLFCYFFMLQIALNAAVQFSKWMNFGADEWRAEDYIGFVVKFMLGMGLSFELPVVLLTLVKLELLDYQRMNQFRPYWVVINLVIAAVLTPPDVVSQLLMAIPLQLLYEISVLIAWYWHRRDQKRLAREQAP